MKRLLSTIVLAGLITASPAFARDRNDRGYAEQSQYKHDRNYAREANRDRRNHHRNYRNNRNQNGLIFGAIAGAVIGSVLSRNTRSEYNDQYYYYYDVQPERRCYEMRHIDRYGRIYSTYDCR